MSKVFCGGCGALSQFGALKCFNCDATFYGGFVNSTTNSTTSSVTNKHNEPTFDETTKQKAEEWHDKALKCLFHDKDYCVYDLAVEFREGFISGRESVKESLAIAVRGLTLSCCCVPAAEGQMEKCDACDALELISERGDLP